MHVTCGIELLARRSVNHSPSPPIPDNLLAAHYTLLTKQENNKQQTCTRETRDKKRQCSMLRLNYIRLRLILHQDPFRVLGISLYFLLFLTFYQPTVNPICNPNRTQSNEMQKGRPKPPNTPLFLTLPPIFHESSEYYPSPYQDKK
jgi:hypothetical protein